MDDGPEEQYVYGHNEGLFIPNPSDAASMEASARFIKETDVKDGVEQDLLGSLSIPLAVESGQALSQEVVSKLSDYYGWAKRIKETFDPDDLAEGTAYLRPEDVPGPVSRR